MFFFGAIYRDRQLANHMVNLKLYFYTTLFYSNCLLVWYLSMLCFCVCILTQFSPQVGTTALESKCNGMFHSEGGFGAEVNNPQDPIERKRGIVLLVYFLDDICFSVHLYVFYVIAIERYKGPTFASSILKLVDKVMRVVEQNNSSMILWRGWCGTLKRVIWYFEEGGLVLWRGWCVTLKRAVWYLVDKVMRVVEQNNSSMIIFSARCGYRILIDLEHFTHTFIIFKRFFVFYGVFHSFNSWFISRLFPRRSDWSCIRTSLS